MTDATHGLPIHGEADPTFGRSYAVRGEFTPTFTLPAGWWIVPAVLLGNWAGNHAFGKVSDAAQRDPKTVALRDAGKIIRNDSEHWVSSLIPIGDGLLVATKV